MCRTLESYSGSYAGRIAPPGIPKATSTPSASSDRTSEPAPEAGVGDTVATAGTPAAAATVAGVARWARVSGVGLVMAIQTFVLRWAGRVVPVREPIRERLQPC